LIFHSDRGSQYASHDFRVVLKEYGITSSMSRKGNCWDNAGSETLFGSLKVEQLHGQRFKPGARPRMKSSTGCSGATGWTALDAGLCQPDAVRAGLACQPT
jgi:transposase InsO family protein